MSCGNLEFEQCSLVVVVIAEHDHVTVCDNSCLVIWTVELGFISSTVMDEGLKLGKLFC